MCMIKKNNAAVISILFCTQQNCLNPFLLNICNRVKLFFFSEWLKTFFFLKKAVKVTWLCFIGHLLNVLICGEFTFFSLRVLTPTFTAYILATHGWEEGTHVPSDHLGFLSPLPSPHILLHFPPFLCFFASSWLYYTSFLPFFHLFIHPSLLPKSWMLLEVEGKSTELS